MTQDSTPSIPATVGQRPWRSLLPEHPSALPAARSQVHHALQLVSAVGISFLAPAADDSHTNLGWSPRDDALVSRDVAATRGRFQLGLRVSDLTLLSLMDGQVERESALHELSLSDAAAGVRSALGAAGLDPARYTLKRHFDIPPDPLATGATFDGAHGPGFRHLAACLAGAQVLLGEAAAQRGGSEVRLWPHHADLATLFTVAPGRTTGAGLALGDASYDVPYFYVNVYPSSIDVTAGVTLAGGGHWHTEQWVGAVLPVSRIDPDPTRQPGQAREFLDSALAATTRFLAR